MEPGSTLLIDAASLIYRALFAVPDSIKAPDGTLVNAAYGFLGMIERLVSRYEPEYICCAADDDWRPEWRVELVESYKAHRAEEGSAQEDAEDLLADQVPIVFEILTGCGIVTVGHAGYEAEDVIGTLAQRAPGKVGIVSGDRDLFQLVRDPDIVVLYPKRGVTEMDVVDESYIAEKYGIPGHLYRDFATLRGDPSDGLPGVRGIGQKLAATLVTRYGSIDGIIEAINAGEQSTPLNKVKRELDYVERAFKVVTIPTDLPIPEVDISRPRQEPEAHIFELAEQYALGGQLGRLVGALTGAGTEGHSRAGGNDAPRANP